MRESRLIRSGTWGKITRQLIKHDERKSKQSLINMPSADSDFFFFVCFELCLSIDWSSDRTQHHRKTDATGLRNEMLTRFCERKRRITVLRIRSTKARAMHDKKINMERRRELKNSQKVWRVKWQSAVGFVAVIKESRDRVLYFHGKKRKKKCWEACG